MVCHEMAFLPPPPSDHHQYFLHHHPQLHNPQDFLGGVHDPSSLAMMNHHHHHQHQMTSPVVSSHVRGDVDHDDLSDDGSQLVLGEKKKRLSLEQVKTLEKNFELGNKLEPERKLQLAKALGLQPRQVAIWFQNRRARWKTKQLEKDYNVLKRQFDAIRSDNDSLLSLNKKLHSELLALKSGTTSTNPTTSALEGAEFGSINLNTTTTTTKSYCNWSNNGSEISSDINLGMSTTISPTSHHHEESPSSNNKMQFAAPHFIPTSLTDLLTSSSSTPKPSDHPHHQIQDDTFCSLFGGGGAGGGGGGGVGDQTPFWAWAPNSLN